MQTSKSLDLVILHYEVERRVQEVNADYDRIVVQSRPTQFRFPSSDLEKRIRIEIVFLDKWLVALYTAYKKTLERQKLRETPELLRRLLTDCLLPFLEQWKQERVTRLKSQMFDEEVQKHKSSWGKMVEVEARTLEYSQEKQVVERLEKAGEGKIHRAARQDSRKARIAEIKRDRPEKANDIRFVCVKLDASNTCLPHDSQWEDKSKQRTWVGNYDYKDTRSAVQRYISVVQPASPMRKRHL